MNTELDVLAEGRVELVKLFTIFSNLVEELKGLLDNVLLDDLHDLVLLKGFTRQIQWKILRVDDALDKAEPFRNKVSSIVGNEDAANIELDVVLGLLSLEEIERCALWYEEDCTEFELTFNGEVLDSQVVLPIAAKTLVFPTENSFRKTYLDSDL